MNHARLALALAALVLVSTLGATTGVAAGSEQTTERAVPGDACVGTVTEQPDEETVVSIQGTRVTDDGREKEHALLASYEPNGSFAWARNASDNGRWWAYDVDRTDDGDLLFASTEPGHSVVGELAPDGSEYRWVTRFDGDPDDEETPLVTDAHDADLVSEDELVIADKGEGHERLLVYNLTRDEVVWEWRFDEHTEAFPRDGGGPPEDWTHLNDVDAVGEDWFLISVRNFDQVAFVNRTTGEVDLTLGEDGNHDVLHRHHNPDYLEGPDGAHTLLVADSLNDRVVEYEYDAEADEWERVWTVTGLAEPRDADRLPNGNTLVTDRKGHRVLEVAPDGEVVWEVYTPFEPYDAERGGPGSEGPTMREQGVEGSVEPTGWDDFSAGEIADCARATFRFASPDGEGADVRNVSEGDENGAAPDEQGTDWLPLDAPTGLVVGAGLAVVAVLGVAIRRLR